MLGPVEIRVPTGRVLLAPVTFIPSHRRPAAPYGPLQQIFGDQTAVKQLHATWPTLQLGPVSSAPFAPSDMRCALESAHANQRLTLIAVPNAFDHPLPFDVEPAKAGTLPVAKKLSGVPTVVVRAPVDSLSPTDKAQRALAGSFKYVRGDLKAEIPKLDAPEVLRAVAAFCALVALAQSGGPIAAALDAVLLAYGYYLLGLNGLKAAMEFAAASYDAITAKTDADIEVAARRYADAFEHLGSAFIAWLLVRVQTRNLEGSGSGKITESETSSSAGSSSTSEAPPLNPLRANAVRGAASESRVLKDLGLTKNTETVYTKEGRSIPDALTDTLSVEIKDVKYVSLTTQIRIQTEAARAAGRQSVLITGENTVISGPASRAFDIIIRRPDLGPQ